MQSELRIIMQNPIHHAYYTIGENKGKPRIWLQGGNLNASGFTKGEYYDVVFDVDSGEIIYKITDSPTKSSRVVSGRVNKVGKVSPIIDLATFSIVDVTKSAQKVRADFYTGEIRVSIHHMEVKQQEREQRLVNNMKSGEVTKGVLCCGIGVSAAAGHDGLAMNGIKARTEFIIDRERKYLDVAQQNNHAVSSCTRVFEASLEEIEPHLLGFVDMLSFSLPCTGHSPSGKAKNKISVAEEHPLDAIAILGLIRIIDACQPSILISENVVPAMTSATYILLKAMLNACGYNVSEVVLDSNNTQSIENRRRYWFVATSKGLNTVDLTQFPSFEKQYNTLGDLMESVPNDSPMWKSTAEKIRKAAVNKENGKNFGFNLITSDAERIGTCGKGYHKNRATEPHIKGDGDTMRLLTVNELAKAQSTPLHLVKDTIDGVAYEGLGQSIDYRQCLGIFDVISKQVLRPMAMAS